MLPKNTRLGAKEVVRLNAKGRRIQGRHFSIAYMSSERAAFAVSVGKSATVGSVERNRMRRRVYALLETCVVPKITHPVHVVIGVRKSAFSLTIEELNAELMTLCARAGIV